MFRPLTLSAPVSELLWVAPELLRNPVPGGSFAGDIFSFAIIIQEVITRMLPYSMMDMPARGERAARERPPRPCPGPRLTSLSFRDRGAAEEAPSSLQTCGVGG